MSDGSRLAPVTLGAVFLGLCAFAAVFGFNLLSPDAPLWLNPPNDMAAASAGWLAFLAEPWSFPPTTSEALLAPQRISIVYTDSIPLLSLLLKASGIGGRTHLLGVFLLVSCILQPLGMVAVLRAAGVERRLTLLLGAGMSLLFPAWLVMLLGHISLAGHWILLFALALSIAAARRGLSPGRIAGFAGLGAVSLGVHVYHLPPVAACFGAAILSDLLQRERAAALGRGAIAAVVFALACAAAAAVFGYAVGKPASGGGGVLGFYSMNILGPVIPQASALFGQAWTGAWFEGTFDPNGGQWYEGYNYLGAGALSLIAAGALASIVKRRGSPPPLRRFGPLALALLALALFAVGPQPYLAGWKVADLGQPSGLLGEWIGFFRCHGRFFWTAGYALIAWALVALDARLRWPWMALVGGACLALQAYDASGLLQALKTSFDRRYADQFPESFRTAPQLASRDWRFYPTFSCAGPAEPPVMVRTSQLSVLALRRGGTTNSAPTARGDGTTCEPTPDLLRTAPPGSRLLTVILPGEKPESRLALFARRRDCWSFEGAYLCGAGLDGVKGLAPVEPAAFAPRKVARDIRLDGGMKQPELRTGWSIAEPGGVWSDGRRAILVLPPSDWRGRADIAVELTALGYDPPPADTPQEVEVWARGRRLALWRVRETFAPHLAVIPTRGLAEGSPLEIELRIRAPGSPAAIDPSSPDRRLLGIAVNRMRILH